jgi:hemolysin activation/secretion protein
VQQRAKQAGINHGSRSGHQQLLRAAPALRRDALWFGILMLAWPTLHAQTVPNAGSVLRETAPAPRPLPPVTAPIVPVAPAAAPTDAAQAPAVTFVLKQVEFSGNTIFDTATLQALVADKVGQNVSFADLEALAARVSAHYRDAGYALAQVVLPAQSVSGGNVAMSIIEGRLNEVRIESQGDLPVSEAFVRKVIAPVRTGAPLQRRVLERAMLLLTDLPGLAPQSSLESGNEPGTFDLIIDLKPGKRVNYSIDADNYGSRSTRETRVGGFVRVNSPFGRGDNLDLRVLSSTGKGLAFGRVGYEMPVNHNGLRAGVAYSHLEYELIKELAALGATGKAKVAEASLSVPLYRSRLDNFFGRLSYEHKALTDDLSAVGQSSRKNLNSVGAGFVYEARDASGRGGYSNLGLTVYAGNLTLGSIQERAADQAPNGLHTSGRNTRLVYQASRLQALTATTSVLLAAAGQWTNSNLDSAEKISAGGSRAVRAFASSSGLGDEVHVLNAEYRWAFRPEASLAVFHDTGWVSAINHKPFAGVENSYTLRGAGLGLTWNTRSGFSLRSSVAWRLGDKRDGDPERNPRLYVQVMQAF